MAKIATEAAKFSSRKEFELGSPKGYAAARRHSCLDAVCSHMSVPARGYSHHCVYAYVFCDAVYIGLTCNRNRRFLEHLEEGPVSRHSKSTGVGVPKPVILCDNLLPDEAREIEKKILIALGEEGVPILNAASGGSLGSYAALKWTKERLINEAQKYGTRREFELGSPGAYYRAVVSGILDELCGHMSWQHRRFSDEDLIVEAMKYRTRTEFQKKDGGAYNAARKRGLLDVVCAHMQRVPTGRKARAGKEHK